MYMHVHVHLWSCRLHLWHIVVEKLMVFVMDSHRCRPLLIHFVRFCDTRFSGCTCIIAAVARFTYKMSVFYEIFAPLKLYLQDSCILREVCL